MTSTGPETSETPGATTQRHGFGIDVGGSGIKGGIVDLDTGQLIGDRIKLLTPQPATPLAVAKTIAEVVNGFGWRGPLGVTYPGVVTHGVVRTAANVDKSWTRRGPTAQHEPAILPASRGTEPSTRSRYPATPSTTRRHRCTATHVSPAHR